MTLILVVEDDPTTRILHANALSSLVGVSVVLTGTLADANAIITQAAPDLVVLDLRLPDGSGLDLLPVLGRCTQPAAVLVVSAYTGDLTQETAPVTRLSVINKPISADEVRRLASEALRIARTTSPFSFAEYLQMACLGRHTLVFEVTTAEATGFVAVREGEVWAAGFHDLRALPAFYALADLEDCTIETRSWREPDLPRELAGSCQELLLEAARRHDERQSLRAPAVDDSAAQFRSKPREDAW